MMKVNQFIVLMSGLATAGLGVVPANADSTGDVPAKSPLGMNTSQSHPDFQTMTKEQLVEHLAQAAEGGCRCCGRCHC